MRPSDSESWLNALPVPASEWHGAATHNPTMGASVAFGRTDSSLVVGDATAGWRPTPLWQVAGLSGVGAVLPRILIHPVGGRDRGCQGECGCPPGGYEFMVYISGAVDYVPVYAAVARMFASICNKEADHMCAWKNRGKTCHCEPSAVCEIVSSYTLPIATAGFYAGVTGTEPPRNYPGNPADEEMNDENGTVHVISIMCKLDGKCEDGPRASGK